MHRSALTLLFWAFDLFFSFAFSFPVLFYAPTRHTKQLNLYIYISVYCTIINSFCLWRHTHKKKTFKIIPVA